MNVGGGLSIIQIEPIYKERDTVNLCFAFDSSFVPYFAASLKSILLNRGNRNYDLCVLHSELKDEDINKLNEMVVGEENVTLRFFDVSSLFDNNEPYTKTHFINTKYSKEMYYKLFIPWLFTHYEKIAYIDADTISLCDIAELFDIDVSEHPIAAVRDYYGLAICTGINKEIEKNRASLNLVNPNDYFSSGVLIFNTEEFRKRFSLSEMMSLITNKKWKQHDQDILNVLCNDSVKILDGKYNLNIDLNNICTHLPKPYLDDYKKSSVNPKLIHYFGKYKPSQIKKPSLYNHFWKNLYQTPFFQNYFDQIDDKYHRIMIIESFLEQKIEYSFDDENHDFIFFSGTHRICKSSDFIVSLVKFGINEETVFFNGYIRVPDKLFVSNNITPVIVNGNKISELMIKKIYHDSEDLILYRELWLTAECPISDGDEIRFGLKIKNDVSLIKQYDFQKAVPFSTSYKRMYYLNGKHMLTFENNSIVIKKKDPLSIIKHEVGILLDAKRNESKRAFLTAILTRTTRLLRPIMFGKKKIWLIYDRIMRGGDNGECFYDYCLKNPDDNLKVYYVIDSKSVDYKRIPGAVRYMSLKHKLLSVFTNDMISSQFDPTLYFIVGMYEFNKDIICNQKRIFLQHGIIKDDMSKQLNIKKHVFDKFVTSTKTEYESILKYEYGYTEKEVILTGLPRYDRLYNEPKKIITISLTWRRELFSERVGRTATWVVGKNFENSTYCKFINELLTNRELIEYTESKGYLIQFLPHPVFNVMMDPKTLFKNDPRVKVLEGAVNYTKIYAESNIMITDFSSMIFDFAYLKKPVIYTHFDVDERGFNFTKSDFFSYENDGFGDIVHTVPELTDKIKEIIEGGCEMSPKYKSRVDNFFEYFDKNNCKRIYDILIEDK